MNANTQLKFNRDALEKQQKELSYYDASNVTKCTFVDTESLTIAISNIFTSEEENDVKVKSFTTLLHNLPIGTTKYNYSFTTGRLLYFLAAVKSLPTTIIDIASKLDKKLYNLNVYDLVEERLLGDLYLGLADYSKINDNWICKVYKNLLSTPDKRFTKDGNTVKHDDDDTLLIRPKVIKPIKNKKHKSSIEEETTDASTKKESTGNLNNSTSPPAPKSTSPPAPTSTTINQASTAKLNNSTSPPAPTSTSTTTTTTTSSPPTTSSPTTTEITTKKEDTSTSTTSLSASNVSAPTETQAINSQIIQKSVTPNSSTALASDYCPNYNGAGEYKFSYLVATYSMILILRSLIDSFFTKYKDFSDEAITTTTQNVKSPTTMATRSSKNDSEKESLKPVQQSITVKQLQPPIPLLTNLVEEVEDEVVLPKPKKAKINVKLSLSQQQPTTQQDDYDDDDDDDIENKGDPKVSVANRAKMKNDEEDKTLTIEQQQKMEYLSIVNQTSKIIDELDQQFKNINNDFLSNETTMVNKYYEYQLICKTFFIFIEGPVGSPQGYILKGVSKEDRKSYTGLQKNVFTIFMHKGLKLVPDISQSSGNS